MRFLDLGSWPWERTVEPQGTTTPPDLTEDWDVLCTLLLHSDEWRLRAVEQLTVRSARVGVRHRSLHVNPLSPLLDEYIDEEDDRAFVLMPVVMMAKRPLFAFDVTADGQPAYLVHRGAIAEREAAHVVALADIEGVATDAITEAFLTAICEFTPTLWERFRGTYRFPALALRRYLEQGLSGTPLTITKREFQTLHAEAEAIGRHLRDALGENARSTSSADNPLLAAPLLAARGYIQGPGDLQEALRSLRDFTNNLAAATNPQQSLALRTLAGYGRRWLAVAWCDVPLRRPFVITTEHQVPLRFRGLRSWARQPFQLADARSNHVTLEVADENVEIAKVQLRGVDNKPTERTLATGLRGSREHYGLYTSEPDRDERVLLRFRLKVPWAIRGATTIIHALTWTAVALIAMRLYRTTLTVDDLAVLAVPTTFAASLLLTRERNSLAHRLQRLSRAGTALATVALWGLAAYAYVGEHFAPQ